MIKVIDNWIIDTDGYCFIAGELTDKKDKKGNVIVKSKTYHAGVSDAARRIMNEKIKDAVADGDKEMREFFAEMVAINDKFKSILSEVKSKEIL
jgi:iron only hydrogenase large subunit-like protein